MAAPFSWVTAPPADGMTASARRRICQGLKAGAAIDVSMAVRGADRSAASAGVARRAAPTAALRRTVFMMCPEMRAVSWSRAIRRGNPAVAAMQVEQGHLSASSPLR